MQECDSGSNPERNSTMFMPDMLESGTPNNHSIASINAGIDFINKIIINIFLNYVKSILLKNFKNRWFDNLKLQWL